MAVFGSPGSHPPHHHHHALSPVQRFHHHLRRVASPRYLILLVVFCLVCGLFVRNWQSLSVLVAKTDSLQITWGTNYSEHGVSRYDHVFNHAVAFASINNSNGSNDASNISNEVHIKVFESVEISQVNSTNNRNELRIKAFASVNNSDISSTDGNNSINELIINPYIHVKRPKRANGTLYRCGFGTGRLVKLLFDDFLTDEGDNNSEPLQLPPDDTTVPRFTRDNVTNAADILYFGSVTGPCHPGINQMWLNQNFPGKVLFQNGEAHSDGRGSNSYMISSLPNSDRNILVPFVSVVFAGQVPSPELPVLLWKDTARPRNNGSHFLVYATSNCVAFRNNVALALSSVGMIHHGKCRPWDRSDNFTSLVDDKQGIEWSLNFRIFSKFRFCLVMENRRQDGYITEKILNAFLGGCVPIWYGTSTDIWKIFHRNSFLYVDAEQDDSIQELVERVRYLESNRTAYDEIFSYPILANGNETLEQWFSLDDSIGQGKLKHQIRVMMGLEDEHFRQIG